LHFPITYPTISVILAQKLLVKILKLSNSGLYNDQEIIERVCAGGRVFDEISAYLFQEYLGYIPTLKNKLHLSVADLQDAYSDALVRLIRQLKTGKFKGESKLSSYFYTIFYNAAVDVSRKNTSYKNSATEELFEYTALEQDLFNKIDTKDQMRQLMFDFERIGEQCKKILMDWGYYGYSMEEIAIRCNLSNAESARSMKYKCLKKLKLVISNSNI